MKKLKFALILFIFSFTTIFTGCIFSNDDTTATENLDWTLHGVWFKNGKETDITSDFSITATLPTEFQLYQKESVAFGITWPKETPYRNAGTESVYAYPLAFESTAIACPGYYYNRITNSATFVITYLYPEDGFVVLLWSDYPQYALVAATDPNADLAELLEYSQLLKPDEDSSLYKDDLPSIS